MTDATLLKNGNAEDSAAEVPTLNNIIQAGDDTIIQTARISQQLGRQMDANLGPELSREIVQALSGEGKNRPDEALEAMLDDIIDRHIETLRRDIRNLLERAVGEN